MKTYGLTDRQWRVACLIADGRTDKEIAGALGIRPQSVRFHVVGIALELGVDRTKNVRVCIANRINATPERAGGTDATEPPADPYGGRVVYYARDGDEVKIGVSADAAQRVKGMQTVRPRILLIATEPGDEAVEVERHQQFAHVHIAREWFDWCDDIAEHVARITQRSA